jgi:predicted ATP-grasp superfamily ATP-dependent carboligase
MNKANSPAPACLLLGGGANALSLARSLGRARVKVLALNDPKEQVCFSRYCRSVRVPWCGSDEESWTRFLLGPDSDRLRGAVLLACNDVGLQILAHHREGLRHKFRLDISNPAAQLAMLDKLSTYRQAMAAGIPTPRFWRAESRTALIGLRDQMTFPLIVKPLLSHVFGERFGGKKYVRADNFDQLLSAFGKVSDARVDVMLVELIPGPDRLLCSYYTYLDEEGRPLFDFTKRIIRRFPPEMGEGCYHVTDWNPEVKEVSLRLFRQAGLRGLANAEFKRDLRDGRLKLIECNARFTAANCLVAESGLDLGLFVYNRIVGGPLPPMDYYATGKRLWAPLRDFKAFLELRKKGELGLWQWLGSLGHPSIRPYFRWDDPLPSIVTALRAAKVDAPLRWLKKVLGGCTGRLTSWLASLGWGRRPAVQQSP